MPFKRSQEGLFQGRTRQSGFSIPFSKHKSRRYWLPNVQNKRFFSDILQEDKEDNDDTSNIEYSADAMTMTWEPPVSALSSKSCCDAV